MSKLLIFDWDGTLVDSAEQIVTCMQAAACDCGLPVLDYAAISNIIGLALPEALRVLYPGLHQSQVERMRNAYSDHFLGRSHRESPLFEGVEEGLWRLSEAGYLLAVATGKSRRGLDRALDETGLGGLFQFTRCADETASKPDPKMLHELLDESGVVRTAAVMIGDTEYDLEMASNARIMSVGVSYGVHSVERLRQHAPQIILNRFLELEPWLHAQQQSGLAV